MANGMVMGGRLSGGNGSGWEVATIHFSSQSRPSDNPYGETNDGPIYSFKQSFMGGDDKLNFPSKSISIDEIWQLHLNGKLFFAIPEVQDFLFGPVYNTGLGYLGMDIHSILYEMPEFYITVLANFGE